MFSTARWGSYLPLFLVFLSGIGFSIQTLFIKLLREQSDFSGSFQCVFMRGFTQLILASIFIYRERKDKDREQVPLFGSTTFVKWMLFLRSLVGYGGIAFSFLSVERLPIGDSTVLVMLSPLFASIFSCILLGEAWRAPELIATLFSLTGVSLVSRPVFLFGGGQSADTIGVSYAISAALSAGLAYTLVRILGTTACMPWSNVCFSQAIGQIVLSIPCLYIYGQRLRFDLSLWQYSLLFGGGFIGAWSQIAMTVGMQREKSATATGMRMSDVLFGFVWQVLFTPVDAVSWLSLLGAFMVSASILIIVLFKPKANNDGSKTGTGGGGIGGSGDDNAIIIGSELTMHGMLSKDSKVDDDEDEEEGNSRYKIEMVCKSSGSSSIDAKNEDGSSGSEEGEVPKALRRRRNGNNDSFQQQQQQQQQSSNTNTNATTKSGGVTYAALEKEEEEEAEEEEDVEKVVGEEEIQGEEKTPTLHHTFTFEQRMLDIYQLHNPDKIKEIPSLLTKYKGQEEEMLKHLERKYCIEATEAAAAAAAANTAHNPLHSQ